MKKKVTLAMLLAIVSLATVFTFSGCDPKDKEKPEDILLPPSLGETKVETTINYALVTVDISSPGGSAISELGVIFESKNIIAIESPTALLTKFTVGLTNLQPNTDYSVKAYAINSSGTTKGTEVIFKTKAKPQLEKITDIDGNQYEIIVIGTQTWTVQDLKVKHYRDGTPIPELISSDDWNYDRNGGFRYYNNDNKNPIPLYNFYAVMSEHQIAPLGWHVATVGDTEKLFKFLDPNGYTTGNKMKETGTTHWPSPNNLATNSSGFTAIPTGYCNGYGEFSRLNLEARWLSVTDQMLEQPQPFICSIKAEAPYFNISYTEDKFTLNGGAAIRLVKD